METLSQEQVLSQRTERDKPGRITEYDPATLGKPLAYHSTRNRGRCSLLCRHWTAPRDLRQERRYLVVLANGQCRLGERSCLEGYSLRDLQGFSHVCQHACPKFEKISELRAKNMTEQQRKYAGMNCRKTKVSKQKKNTK